MSIKEQIMDKINYYTENALDVLGEIDKEIIKVFNDNMFNEYEYKIDIQNVFDSPGLDVYVLAVSWVDNGFVEMLVDSIEIC